MPYEIETKDGIVLRGIPDDIGPDDPRIKEKVMQARSAQKPDPSEGGLPLRPFGLDTGLTMPQGVSRFAAGAGKALTDMGRGAGQIMGIGPNDEETLETRKRDAPLMKTGAGFAGNLAGGLAATLPTLAIPGVNTYTGAAGLGAAMGALQPTTEDESKLQNAAVGAGAGVLGQGVGNAMARALRPVQSRLGPEEMRLAAVAAKEGIPLDAAAQTGSKPLQTMNAVMENLPFTAGPQAAQNQARQAAFNAAALKRAGIKGESATPDVLAARKAELGKTFEDVSSRNKLDFNKGLGYDLTQIADTAAKRLPKDQAAAFRSTIDDLLSEAQRGVMEGAKYQGWRSELGRLAKGTDAEAHYFAQAKKALDGEFNKQVSKADAELWKTASREYSNLKTILQSMGGSGVAANTGNIAPAQLAMALRQSVGTEGKALGRGELNDLVRVGQKFVKQPIADSGSASRLLYQSLLTGGGATLGAGGALATGKDPLEGAMYGAAGMGASLAIPRMAQAIMQSKLAQGYMKHQAASETMKELAQVLKNSGRSLGAASVLPYMAEQ